MAITTSSSSGGGADSQSQALAQLAQALGGGASSSSGKVYMGMINTKQPVGVLAPGRSASTFSSKQKANWLSVDQANQYFYQQSDKFRQDFQNKAIIAGILQPGDGPLQAGQLWQQLVAESANYGAAGAQVGPMDLLASYVKAAGGAGAWQSLGAFQKNTVTGELKYNGPGVYLGNGLAQETQTQVNLTDPDTAKEMATQLFQQLMGRDPRAGELDSFADAVHTAEAANPTTQTTTTQYNTDTGQEQSSNTTTSGGVTDSDRQFLGEQQIKGTKEYGAFQAATTYMGALESLVGGGGGQ
jgi:hypothetical protein